MPLMDTDKHMVEIEATQGQNNLRLSTGTLFSNKANRLEDKGILRMAHYGFVKVPKCGANSRVHSEGGWTAPFIVERMKKAAERIALLYLPLPFFSFLA